MGMKLVLSHWRMDMDQGVWEQGAEENIRTWKEEVTGEWRRLHNEELHNLYDSPNIIRVIRDEIKEDEMGWACSSHLGEMWNA
jgi:hypothetical protein